MAAGSTYHASDGAAYERFLGRWTKRLAEPHGPPGRVCGAGILHDITSGKPYSMYRDAPLDHASCHLDAADVVGACAAVLGQIPMSDLIVLNKFGKLEAMGKGLAAAFDAAVAIENRC